MGDLFGTQYRPIECGLAHKRITNMENTQVGTCTGLQRRFNTSSRTHRVRGTLRSGTQPFIVQAEGPIFAWRPPSSLACQRSCRRVPRRPRPAPCCTPAGSRCRPDPPPPLPDRRRSTAAPGSRCKPGATRNTQHTHTHTHTHEGE